MLIIFREIPMVVSVVDVPPISGISGVNILFPEIALLKYPMVRADPTALPAPQDIADAGFHYLSLKNNLPYLAERMLLQSIQDRSQWMYHGTCLASAENSQNRLNLYFPGMLTYLIPIPERRGLFRKQDPSQ